MTNRPWPRRQFLDKLLFLARKLPAGQLRKGLEISLRGLPDGHPAGCRAERINSLSKQLRRCEDYLEIGVQFGFTLASVDIKNKTGVDPALMFNPRFAPGVILHRATSDEFFEGLSPNALYDVIFLDGLHTFEQTARDFLNALRHLKPGGFILVDDVVPTSEAKALPDRGESLRRQLEETATTDGEWFGDVWKLPVAVERIFQGELQVKVVGFGVCGQAVFWETEPGTLNKTPDIREFLAFEGLKFRDYFPQPGEVLLPGYTQGQLDLNRSN